MVCHSYVDSLCAVFLPRFCDIYKDEEVVRTFDERSTECDSCNVWFHFGCVQMSNNKLKEIGVLYNKKASEYYVPVIFIYSTITITIQ